ncbi:hypothetical protein RintRC_5680 [Richelia intracellularis]|nr:hypothetical protein RintRC_5680 [Richelia intracellularis]
MKLDNNHSIYNIDDYSSLLSPSHNIGNKSPGIAILLLDVENIEVYP